MTSTHGPSAHVTCSSSTCSGPFVRRRQHLMTAVTDLRDARAVDGRVLGAHVTDPVQDGCAAVGAVQRRQQPLEPSLIHVHIFPGPPRTDHTGSTLRAGAPALPDRPRTPAAPPPKRGRSMGPFAAACATYGTAIGAVGLGASLLGHPMGGSDHVAAELEGWQFVTEEGPSVDSFIRGCMIEADDVRSSRSAWPQLTEFLDDAGVHSVCSLPLMAGPRPIGASDVLPGHRRATRDTTAARRRRARRARRRDPRRRCLRARTERRTPPAIVRRPPAGDGRRDGPARRRVRRGGRQDPCAVHGHPTTAADDGRRHHRGTRVAGGARMSGCIPG